MFVVEFNNYSIAGDESMSLISLLQGTPYVPGKRVAGILEMSPYSLLLSCRERFISRVK